MSIKVSGTAITFPDATTQTTAASYTAGNGISISSGSIALGVPTNSTVGTYTAGNIGYANIAIGTTTVGANISISPLNTYGAFNDYNSIRGSSSMGLSGTWRACTPTTAATYPCCCVGTVYYGSSALWIRIA